MKNEKTEFEKKQGVMDRILILIAILLITFIVVMIWIFCRYMAIPDTLCTCVFAACTGELGFMSFIQNSKNKYREREWEKEDKAADRQDQGIPPEPEDQQGKG